MCGVFLNNDVDLHTLCVEKDFNYYLRPFSTMIRLTRLSKSKKKIFSTKVVETRRIHPIHIALKH